MIVGEFEISKILEDTPEKIWEDTEKQSGITKSFYDSYFENRDKAYALKIGNLKKYDNPINPYKIFENFIPPQSFRYLYEDVLSL